MRYVAAALIGMIGGGTLALIVYTVYGVYQLVLSLKGHV